MHESFLDEHFKYDNAWFQERAFTSISKISSNEWDYSDSLLMYTPGHDATYEDVQDVNNPYHEIVTAPERTYLKRVAPRIVEKLRSNFALIDLGPGTEQKEQFIFDEAKRRGKDFTYVPVDISQRYLDLSATHAEEQGITTKPIRSSFEELPILLDGFEQSRLVSLGLTYSNYNPREILRLLKEIRGESGSIFINSQIRERSDIERIRAIYCEVAVGMTEPKLQLLGLNPEKDVTDLEVTDEVKLWYTVKNLSQELEEIGIKEGDRMLLFQSLRPTLDQLNEDVSAEFDDYELLDTGDSFVGVVTK